MYKYKIENLKTDIFGILVMILNFYEIKRFEFWPLNVASIAGILLYFQNDTYKNILLYVYEMVATIKALKLFPNFI